MSRTILLVTWDGAGNLQPERSLMRALVARGHAGYAVAHDSVRETLAGDGMACLPLRGARPYDSMQAMTPEEELPFVVEHVWFARAFGDSLLAAVERVRPDVLVIDICLAHALVAARKTGLPTVVFGHFPYHLLVGPFAPLLASRLEQTNAYAGELGVDAFPSHQQVVEGASLVLVASYRPFDAVLSVAPHVVHVGPLRSGPRSQGFRRRAPERPLVLVGLSTSNQSQAPLLQRLCDALGRLDVEALVTTGPAIDPGAIAAADNVAVVAFAPHDDVLPAADLLVTHAGHGTVMAGATYGVPTLCFPMGRDQPMIAARVAELGLGAAADPAASVDEIARAIEVMLADAGAKRRAREFATSVAAHPGLADAVRMVEELSR